MHVEVLTTTRSRTDAIGAAVRPTFLFVGSYALNITPHEAVHALVSNRLGLSCTLYQMWVDPDAAFATPGQLAAIAVAGPIFSLAVGLVSWFLYKKYKRKPSGLFFLMMTLVGIYSFLGPVAGAAFGGDFNTALRFIGASRAIEFAITAVGFVLLAAFMFFMGKQLSWWAPTSFGRLKNIACTTLAPWIIGPFLIVLIYWPLPRFLIGSTFTGSVFWAFAVVGAVFGSSRTRGSHSTASVTRLDIIALFVAVAMVRVLAHGIHLAH
jgi:hypothetical protein